MRGGAVRFFNIGTHPPWRGRPRVSDTLDLSQMIDQVVERVTRKDQVRWGKAEDD